MKVTYVYHSGFIVELATATLLFDYYKGELPRLDPNKQIYVFSSHSHHDHFNKGIFSLIKTYPNISFVLSSDILTYLEDNDIYNELSEEVRQRLNFIKANEDKLFLNGNIVTSTTNFTDDKFLKVKTLESTDQGVAFLVSIEGKEIFHAGDLHWWTWEGETKQEYKDMTDRVFSEVAKISKVPIDLAFLPLDPRQEDRFYWGFDHYLRTCNIKHAFPMHLWEDYSLITRFKNMEDSKDYLSKIMDIESEGQTFIIE